MMDNYTRELLRCEQCGAEWGAGCDCDSNRRAIGRGERAKAEREERPEWREK